MAYCIHRPLVALAVLLGLGLGLAPVLPAAAAEPDKNKKETPSELMSDAMSQMIRALELFVRSIPQYEKPEITENGDIIIRRKRPETEPAPVPKKGPPRLPDPDKKEEPGKGRTI